ncbi:MULTISPECIES: PEP-CTERM sorting domain-containing protein [Nostoc]|uniref:PEP-CTERM sorting domain-containing protein n=1 Tax=Nostoc paludosum FACHB-159 TaxID=2692908 RepID=A0ABR8KBI8_9NOSO|nr:MULTISPECIES: PEP-CTERM sorting domain-containing protein [Nostoc]MBD2680490.1 PEP-CTERM sorting domain-containing protein [Nostoc sp. FACHB-857]MBD2736880.1 PEP-CTERM sorting domain-containing protein [Nostoc paludosum FACHB-159]
MKFVPQIVLAGSLALGLATVDLKSVSAAIINYAFTVDSPTKKGQGFFSFDDSTFSNDNIPEAIANSVSFQFDGESTIYTEQDDLNYPDFPIVYSIEQTSFVGLEYTFNDINPENFITYEIVGDNFTVLSSTSPNTELFSGKVSYKKVPEPTTLGGVLLACGLVGILKVKGTSIKKVKAKA